jgi:hypothetical protein
MHAWLYDPGEVRTVLAFSFGGLLSSKKMSLSTFPIGISRLHHILACILTVYA